MSLNLYLFPRLRRVLKFALENATDDVLTSMDATQLREFIIDARGPIHLSPCVTTPKTNRFLPFTSPSTYSTPKMGHIRSSGASGELTKYLGPIDVLDNQRSFDSVAVPNQSCSMYLSGWLVHVQSRTLSIWRIT